MGSVRTTFNILAITPRSMTFFSTGEPLHFLNSVRNRTRSCVRIPEHTPARVRSSRPLTRMRKPIEDEVAVGEETTQEKEKAV